MSRIRNFFSLPGGEKLLFFVALNLTLFVKIIVLTMPLRWYIKYLDRTNKPFIKKRNNEEEIIRRVKNAVNRSSRYAPWSTRCLVDAITAKILLQYYGINSTLYMGVQKDKKTKLIAHAWLKCNGLFITGKKGSQKFTVVSTFA